MKQKVSPMIREQLTITDNNIFQLLRRTRAGVPNVNGCTYTHDAFENAMRRYVKEEHSGLYLAPVSFDHKTESKNYDARVITKVNTEVYGRFTKSMPRKDYLKYRVASIVSWDDYSITFRKLDNILPAIDDLFTKYVNDDVMVQMRYSADLKRGIAREIKIMCFDLSVIPYEELGIDVKKICSGN